MNEQCSCFRPGHNLGRASSIAIALLLMVVFAIPVFSQMPPATQFAEIEAHATEARNANRLEEAVKLYQAGLKLRPSWSEGSWYLGTSLYGLKRYAEARDAFRHLAISEPRNGPAWGLAGICEFELKNYPRAFEYLSKAEEAGYGENQELAYLFRFRLALLLNRAGEFEQAFVRFVPIATQGTFPEVVEAMGISILRARLLPSEVPTEDHDLYMRAGDAASAYVANDKETASRLFDQLVESYPNRPNVHYSRGAFLMESAPEKALADFQRELDINPANLLAQLQLANLYLRQGAAEKALPYAREAAKSKPDYLPAHSTLGQALLETGQVKEAIQELQAAIRLAPDAPQPHFALAEAYRRSGNNVLAKQELATFERLDKKQKERVAEKKRP